MPSPSPTLEPLLFLGVPLRFGGSALVLGSDTATRRSGRAWRAAHTRNRNGNRNRNRATLLWNTSTYCEARFALVRWTMSFVAKLANPVLNIKTAAVNYYKPMVRAGSSTPLWHFFMITSGVMYTTNWICLKGGKIKAAKKEKETALAEYYTNHGITPHH